MRLLICLFGILVFISGCSSQNPHEKTIVVGIQNTVFTRKAYAGAKERFEKAHPGVRLKELSSTGISYYQKMQTMFAGNSEPDVMWMGMGFGDFAAKGVLEDLSPYIAREPKDFTANINKQALASYRRGTRQFGLPFGVDFQILCYNKDMFDKAGLKYPNPAWTKNDVLNAARKLTVIGKRRRPEIYGLVGMIDWSSFGGRLVSDNGDQVLVNSPEMAQYLSYTRDLVTKFKVSPAGESEQVVGMNNTMMFATGRSGMIVAGDYDLTNIAQSSKLRWGVCIMPQMGGNTRSIWASTAGFCMSKRCKNKKLAWELIKTYISPEFMKEYYPSTMPSDTKCLKDVLEKDKQFPSGTSEAMIESLKCLYVQPRTKGVFEVQSAFSLAAENFWNTDMAPHQVLTEAEKKIRPLLEPIDQAGNYNK